MYVYVITNSANGKVYVGKTVTPAKRWYQHQLGARNGEKAPLYSAMRKYGTEAFEFAVVETCESEAQSFEREQAWIDKLDATNPARGYNCKGCGGKGRTAATRRSKNFGRALTDEHREALSKAHTKPVDMARIAELRASGATIKDIASELGCGVTTAYKHVSQLPGYQRKPVPREVSAAGGRIGADRRWRGQGKDTSALN